VGGDEGGRRRRRRCRSSSSSKVRALTKNGLLYRAFVVTGRSNADALQSLFFFVCVDIARRERYVAQRPSLRSLRAALRKRRCGSPLLCSRAAFSAALSDVVILTEANRVVADETFGSR
jgi:hypothetical protein